MNNINWGVVAAMISAAAAALGLIFQRIDIRKQNKYQRETFEYQRKVFEHQRRELEKQNKYQRNTFELQNKIEENNLLIEISSEMLSNVSMQAEYLARLYMNKHRIKQIERTSDINNIDREESKDIIEELRSTSKITWDAQGKLSEKFTQLTNTLVIHLTSHELKTNIYNMMLTMGNELNDMKAEIDKNDWSESIKTERELSEWSQKRIEAFDVVFEPFQKVFIDLKKDMERKVSQITKDDF